MVDQGRLYEHSWVSRTVHSDWEDWNEHSSIRATVMRRFSDHGNRGTDCPTTIHIIQHLLVPVTARLSLGCVEAAHPE